MNECKPSHKEIFASLDKLSHLSSLSRIVHKNRSKKLPVSTSLKKSISILTLRYAPFLSFLPGPETTATTKQLTLPSSTMVNFVKSKYITHLFRFVSSSATNCLIAARCSFASSINCCSGAISSSISSSLFFSFFVNFSCK